MIDLLTSSGESVMFHFAETNSLITRSRSNLVSDSEISIQSRKTLTSILKHFSSISKSASLDIKNLVEEITMIGCDCLLSEPSKISGLLWIDLLKTTLPFLDWNEELFKKVLAF
jgi:hypothetical protein